MSYYEDKVDDAVKHDPRNGRWIYIEWVVDLQNELRKASRQIDKLDRKLAIRSRKLGAARAAGEEAARYCCNDLSVDAFDG